MRLALAAVASLAFAASAPLSAQAVNLLGDKDCFGLPGVVSCADGSLFRDELGGAFFTDYSTPGDPAFSDRWFSPATLAWTHGIAVPAVATTATLEFRVAGIANDGRTATVSLNGGELGVLDFMGVNAFQEVRTVVFDFSTALLTGVDEISLDLTSDGFIIDYAELRIDGSTSVPEPAAIWLVVGGVAVLAARRRRTA